MKFSIVGVMAMGAILCVFAPIIVIAAGIKKSIKQITILIREVYMTLTTEWIPFDVYKRLKAARKRIGPRIEPRRLKLSLFRNAELDNLKLRAKNFAGKDFHAANLAFSDLTRSNLKGADLSDSILVNTDLREARLDGAELKGAYYNDYTQLPFSEMLADQLGMIKLAV